MAFPVLLAGWFFGLRAALLTGLASIVLNAILFTLYLPDGWRFWLSTSWFGNMMVIVFGIVAGYLHTVGQRREGVLAQLRERDRYLP